MDISNWEGEGSHSMALLATTHATAPLLADTIRAELAAKGWSLREWHDRHGGPSEPTRVKLLSGRPESYQLHLLRKVSISLDRPGPWLEEVLAGGPVTPRLSAESDLLEEVRDLLRRVESELDEWRERVRRLEDDRRGGPHPR